MFCVYFGFKFNLIIALNRILRLGFVDLSNFFLHIFCNVSVVLVSKIPLNVNILVFFF